MAEAFVVNQESLITITKDAADRLLALRSGDAALLYLYLLRHGSADADAFSALGLTKPVSDCMALLQRAGLVNTVAGSSAAPKEKHDEIPEYTADEIHTRIETDGTFQALLSEAAERLGRTLSGSDMKILFGIYDYLGLPSDVILLLLNWCVREFHRRYGAARYPTLRQIEKEAYRWARQELFSLEAADRYLRIRAARQTESAEVARLLGIRDRTISQTEENYITAWLDMGFRQEAITLAYDKTVTKKGELAWPYMNRILENWHQKNLHTVPEIEAGDRPSSQRRGGGTTTAEKPAADDLERMQRLIERMNGGSRNGT